MSIRPRNSLLDPQLQRPSALKSVPRNPAQLWLDKNENLDGQLMALSHSVLASIPSSILATYPEAGELYRKLSVAMNVDAESLLLTPGSDGAIRLVFEAFVEGGDAVVHTSPTFAMYPVYCQMFGARAIRIEYGRDDRGPTISVSSILEAVRKHSPKLLSLPNPDSPSGSVIEPEALREILSACEAAGTVLLLDEAYHPFYEWSAVQWTKTSSNLIVARTFAKAWGAAGLRIGYAVAQPSTIALLHKMRPMYEVSSIAVEFMTRMMDHAEEMNNAVKRINTGKLFFAERMRDLGFRVLPTHGNFIHVEFGNKATAVRAALAGKVLYRPNFDHPSLDGYSRFSVAPQNVMERVVDLIDAVARKNK